MIITHILRILLGNQFRPYSFNKDRGHLPDFTVPNLGLYVHIPFCKTLCSFCPYYKELFNPRKTEKFIEALCTEIQLAADKISNGVQRKKVSSLYFGGGSPAILINDLHRIREKIDKSFEIIGNTGIELHPRDVSIEIANKLQHNGFDMVSLGVQSFSLSLQKNLGRTPFDAERSLKILNTNSFKAIDVDLIFAIPGQKEDDLRIDFMKAVDLGATQISTYPFIDFSYANNNNHPLNHHQKKKMLHALLLAADEAGFSRTSVWTFGKKNAPRYSSITRDCFLGFGPSATSLGNDTFKVNTFSVDSYIETTKQGLIPTALKMQFSPRARRLYWLFWNCYNGLLLEPIYRELFSSELSIDFGCSLFLGTSLGLLNKTPEGWVLTEKGSYYFHRIEQSYTHQYIDKTWRLSMKTPWPEKINLY